MSKKLQNMFFSLKTILKKTFRICLIIVFKNTFSFLKSKKWSFFSFNTKNIFDKSWWKIVFLELILQMDCFLEQVSCAFNYFLYIILRNDRKDEEYLENYCIMRKCTITSSTICKKKKKPFLIYYTSF